MNFLPREKKIELKKEYIRRLSVVAGLLIFFVFLSGIVFLSPLYVVFKNEELSLNQQLSFFKKNVTNEDAQNLSSSVNSLNKKISIISSFKEFNPDEIIEKIIDKKADGIKITNFQITRDKISLSGVSQTRPLLISFSESLRAEPSFKKVELPISTLIKERDIEFVINIDL